MVITNDSEKTNSYGLYFLFALSRDYVYIYHLNVWIKFIWFLLIFCFLELLFAHGIRPKLLVSQLFPSFEILVFFSNNQPLRKQVLVQLKMERIDKVWKIKCKWIQIQCCYRTLTIQVWLLFLLLLLVPITSLWVDIWL